MGGYLADLKQMFAEIAAKIRSVPRVQMRKYIICGALSCVALYVLTKVLDFDIYACRVMAYVYDHSPAAVVATFALVDALLMLLRVPSFFPCVLTGYFLGPYTGYVSMLIAYVVAGLAARFIGRKYLSEWVRRTYATPWYATVRDALSRNTFTRLSLWIMTPYTSFPQVAYFLSTIPLKLPVVLASILVGGTPMVTLFLFIGKLWEKGPELFEGTVRSKALDLFAGVVALTLFIISFLAYKGFKDELEIHAKESHDSPSFQEEGRTDEVEEDEDDKYNK